MILISISDVTAVFSKLKPSGFMPFQLWAAYELYRFKNLKFPDHEMTL